MTIHATNPADIALDQAISEVVNAIANRLGLQLTDTDRACVASDYRVRALAVTWRNHDRGRSIIADYVNRWLEAGSRRSELFPTPIGSRAPFRRTEAAAAKNIGDDTINRRLFGAPVRYSSSAEAVS